MKFLRTEEQFQIEINIFELNSMSELRSIETMTNILKKDDNKWLHSMWAANEPLWQQFCFFLEHMIVSCNLQVKDFFILKVLLLFMNKIFIHWNG